MVIIGLYNQSRLLKGLVYSSVFNLINKLGVKNSNSF